MIQNTCKLRTNSFSCDCCDEHNCQRYIAYQQGRADELNKIVNMILLGCEELSCDKCDYRLYSQDVCQQAYTIGVIENYIAEWLKEE